METDSSSQGRSGAAVSAPPSGHHHHHHHHRRHRSQRSWWHAWRRRWHHLLTGMAQVPMCGLLILLVMLPLIYQGGEYWWLPVATSLVLVLYVFWGLSAWWLGGETGRWHWHAGMLLFALPLGLGLAQAMPIPDGLVTRLSPSGWPWWEGLRQLGLGDIRPSLSLAPDYTLRTCELLLLCLLTFTLLLQQARHRAALRLVAAAVALSAFVNAAYAFWEFWRDDTGGGMLQMTVFKGAFLNRNHFGFMMHLGALSAMGLLAAVGAAGRRQRDDTSPAWGGILIPMTFMLFGILTAQVLSLSRGAFMATVTAAMCFGLIWLVRGARVAGGRQKVLALAMILGAALLMALPPALSRLSERYQHLLDSESFDGEDRLMVWRDTVALIKDFPWAGTGLGAYGDAIQPYERGVFRDGLIEHAHNDWLEMTAEVGLPMALVIIGLAGWLLGGATRRIWRQKDMTMRWIGLGALAAVLGGLMHEVVDFNLLAMPNAMLFSALLALVFICGRHRSGAVSGPSPAEGGDGRGFVPVGEPLTETLVATEDGTGRWRPRRLVFLAGALVVLAALPWQFRRCQAAWRHMQLYDEVESAGRGWQPGWKDYQRRVALADAALAGFPGHPAILRLRALSLAPLAFLLPGESLELMAAARSDSAAACRRLPADGDTLRIGANIHEQAGLLDGRVDEGLVLGLYERALASQPRITNMLREVAEARRRSFHRLAVREGLAAPATVQSRQRALELYLEYLQAGGGYSQDLFAVIMELTDSQKQLLDILPQDSRMNRVLFDFLVSRQDYGQAFEVQAKMESELPAVTDGAREAVESRRDWLGRQAQLLGLAGQWPARAKLMPEYLGL
ncbi:MAG: O-antigen ligase family protein, partial [Lentisphaeria bacterium]|nr:O-antigen ligase family protein [Lentisphaeria bacterium]